MLGRIWNKWNWWEYKLVKLFWEVVWFSFLQILYFRMSWNNYFSDAVIHNCFHLLGLFCSHFCAVFQVMSRRFGRMSKLYISWTKFDLPKLKMISTFMILCMSASLSTILCNSIHYQVWMTMPGIWFSLAMFKGWDQITLQFQSLTKLSILLRIG